MGTAISILENLKQKEVPNNLFPKLYTFYGEIVHFLFLMFRFAFTFIIVNSLHRK